MFFRYWRWKRMARNAIASGLTAKCALCDNPIVPGDLVGIVDADAIVHAGFHFTLSNCKAFCESSYIGVGFWNGREILPRAKDALIDVCGASRACTV